MTGEQGENMKTADELFDGSNAHLLESPVDSLVMRSQSKSNVIEFDEWFETIIEEDAESRRWYAKCWNAAIERAAQTAREFDYTKNTDGQAEYVAAVIRGHKSV